MSPDVGNHIAAKLERLSNVFCFLKVHLQMILIFQSIFLFCINQYRPPVMRPAMMTVV